MTFVCYQHLNMKRSNHVRKLQNEVPPARVNIKLDLHTGGAKKQVELPLRLLVAGDFSFNESDTPLAEREKVLINKNNFDAVLAEMNPTVKLSVHQPRRRSASNCQYYQRMYRYPCRPHAG
jgi:type VI secretion system ImpB/VipA family protein